MSFLSICLVLEVHSFECILMPQRKLVAMRLAGSRHPQLPVIDVGRKASMVENDQPIYLAPKPVCRSGMDALKFIASIAGRPFRRKRSVSDNFLGLEQDEGSENHSATKTHYGQKEMKRSISQQLTEELLREKHETIINERSGPSGIHSTSVAGSHMSAPDLVDYSPVSGYSKFTEADQDTAADKTATATDAENRALGGASSGNQVPGRVGFDQARSDVVRVDKARNTVDRRQSADFALEGSARVLNMSSSIERWDPSAVMPASFRSSTSLDSSSASLGESEMSFREEPGLPMAPSTRSSSGAKDRWKRLKHSVAFANHISASYRAGNVDLVDEAAVTGVIPPVETGTPEMGASGSKGGGEKLRQLNHSSFKPRGRAGLEGLTVKAEKSLACYFADLYVNSLKMPLLHFVAGVFSAPLILSVLFAPLYLLDIDGLQFDESLRECPADAGLWEYVQHGCSVFVNVLLYALSLSTTFGGSPVDAISPYTLIVANLNTLMAQFLFVFLSGAVFARMSQPGQPVRCSKKAIIRSDDIIPAGTRPGESGDQTRKKHKVFAMRLVLIGPHPSELVDIKITLTFRIFMKMPNGSIFCSTTDLPLVRSEVAYLRYGLMCRHIIDEKSPVYGHTKESLTEGDASFSITLVGMERTSMQSVFHMQDYFVYDGDVVWNGDYHDFVYINEKGIRVLDHSKLDHMKHFKVGGLVSTAITRMHTDAQKRKDEEKEKAEQSTWETLKDATGKMVEEMGGVVGDAATNTAKTFSWWIDKGLRNSGLRSRSLTRNHHGGTAAVPEAETLKRE